MFGVYWVCTLKDGTDVKNFQQWGGPNFKNHPEVEQFAADLKQMYPNGISAAGGGVNVGREIEDRNLKIEAIYGPSYSRGTTILNLYSWSFREHHKEYNVRVTNID